MKLPIKSLHDLLEGVTFLSSFEIIADKYSLPSDSLLLLLSLAAINQAGVLNPTIEELSSKVTMPKDTKEATAFMPITTCIDRLTDGKFMHLIDGRVSMGIKGLETLMMLHAIQEERVEHTLANTFPGLKAA